MTGRFGTGWSNPNDIRLSEPFYLDEVPYPLRTLEWCFCGYCGAYEEKMRTHWNRVAEECAWLVACSAKPDTGIVWAGGFTTGPSDLIVALHRRLLADIRAALRRERAREHARERRESHAESSTA
jgi:hypothetical protein